MQNIYFFSSMQNFYSNLLFVVCGIFSPWFTMMTFKWNWNNCKYHITAGKHTYNNWKECVYAPRSLSEWLPRVCAPSLSLFQWRPVLYGEHISYVFPNLIFFSQTSRWLSNQNATLKYPKYFGQGRDIIIGKF